jgi:hypothetical protein
MLAEEALHEIGIGMQPAMLSSYPELNAGEQLGSDVVGGGKVVAGSPG